VSIDAPNLLSVTVKYYKESKSLNPQRFTARA